MGKFNVYENSEFRYGRPQCERHNDRPHLWALMDDHTVSAAMAGLTISCGRRDGWPHLLLWAPNGWPHGGFPFVCGRLTAGRTFYCGRLAAGPTEVSPIQLNLSSRLWAPNGWPHLILWAPDGCPHGGSHPHQSIVPSTLTSLLLVRSDLCTKVSLRLGGLESSVEIQVLCWS